MSYSDRLKRRQQKEGKPPLGLIFLGGAAVVLTAAAVIASQKKEEPTVTPALQQGSGPTSGSGIVAGEPAPQANRGYVMQAPNGQLYRSPMKSWQTIALGDFIKPKSGR